MSVEQDFTPADISCLIHDLCEFVIKQEMYILKLVLNIYPGHHLTISTHTTQLARPVFAEQQTFISSEQSTADTRPHLGRDINMIHGGQPTRDQNMNIMYIFQ